MSSSKLSVLIFIILFITACQKDAEIPVVEPEEKDPGNSNYSTDFFLKEIIDAETERKRMHRNLKISDIKPTGLFLQPGETVEIEVKSYKGESLPEILLGTFSKNIWYDTPQTFYISPNGKTKILNETSEDQLLFIRYSGPNPGSESTLNFKGGHKAPFFILNTTNEKDFVKMLENYTYSEVILESERATIVVGRNSIIRYKNQNWTLLMTTLNQIIDFQDQIDGLVGMEGTHSSGKNKYLLTESNDDNYWMAATDYNTFYNSNHAIDFLIDLEKLKNDGWGPWHEMGHQRQISSLTWGETVEVTTNIYSLAVQRGFGQISRLKKDGIWDKVAAFFEIPLEERNFNDNDQLGPFERLALYQQLWLKYGDDFFVNLHKKAREEAFSAKNDEEKMGYFVLKAAEVSGHNLNEFFRAWGFVLPERFFSAVDALSLSPLDEKLQLLRE